MIQFKALPNPTQVDASIEVFQGVVAWPSVAGVPSSPTRLNAATLTVMGNLVDFYRYKIDGGAWSSDQAVSKTIALANLASGQHQVSVLGRSQYGSYLAESNAVVVVWKVDANAPSRLHYWNSSNTHSRDKR